MSPCTSGCSKSSGAQWHVGGFGEPSPHPASPSTPVNVKVLPDVRCLLACRVGVPLAQHYCVVSGCAVGRSTARHPAQMKLVTVRRASQILRTTARTCVWARARVCDAAHTHIATPCPASTCLVQACQCTRAALSQDILRYSRCGPTHAHRVRLRATAQQHTCTARTTLGTCSTHTSTFARPSSRRATKPARSSPQMPPSTTSRRHAASSSALCRCTVYAVSLLVCCLLACLLA
jgi:hypothetical protein